MPTSAKGSALHKVSTVHIGPDEQVEILGVVPDSGALRRIELHRLKRSADSVDPESFQLRDTVPIPVHLAMHVAAEIVREARETTNRRTRPPSLPAA
jgi:hypothetical protein